ncbi:MAG: right-handed parallel beta-helix repeat-containing protein, partial [Kiritimatiellia bacterium]
ITATGGALRDCVVAGSRAASGGGVYASGPNTRIGDCHVVGNTGTNGAGGIYAENRTQITNCLVERNTAASGPGGIHLGANSSGEILLLDSEVLNNTSSGSADYGGGIRLYCNGSGNQPVIVRNCLVKGNSPNGVSFVTYAYNQAVQNCTIVSNTGYGVHQQWWYGTGQVYNAIIYDNTSGSISSGERLIFSNCCAFVADPSALKGSGNINGNPAFADSGAGNYRLTKESPCINTGLIQPWMENCTDLDNNSRIDRFSNRADMGCYEHHPRGVLYMVR